LAVTPIRLRVVLFFSSANLFLVGNSRLIPPPVFFVWASIDFARTVFIFPLRFVALEFFLVCGCFSPQPFLSIRDGDKFSPFFFF